jgi:hypothetical protein
MSRSISLSAVEAPKPSFGNPYWYGGLKLAQCRASAGVCTLSSNYDVLFGEHSSPAIKSDPSSGMRWKYNSFFSHNDELTSKSLLRRSKKPNQAKGVGILLQTSWSSTSQMKIERISVPLSPAPNYNCKAENEQSNNITQHEDAKRSEEADIQQ